MFPGVAGPASIDGSWTGRILLIGADELTDVTQRALGEAGARVTRLRNPSDPEIRQALGEEVDAVVVISRDDHVSLRIALVVEGVSPEVALTVTVFDRDVSTQLQLAVPKARVMSMADIVAPALAGPCLDDRLRSVSRTEEGFCGVQGGEDGPRLVPLESRAPGLFERLLANLGSLLRPFELSAKILMAGLVGFHLILLIDIVATAIVLDESLIDAVYSATKTVVTVGPNPHVDDAPGWFKIFSSAMMLSALGLTALFTAGVVNRILDRRLTAIVGQRSLPRKDHVVVVGLGQVGLRLCLLLRELGVRVVAIESELGADYVARAKDYGIPVVIGRGGSRFVLRRLGLERALALAAVTSDEIENISIVVAARGRCRELRTLMRAGRGDVTNETRSLLKLGMVRDVYRIGGTLLAAVALGSDAVEAFLHEQTVYLVAPGGQIEAFGGAPAAAAGP